MIYLEENVILDILKSEGVVAVGDSNIRDKGETSSLTVTNWPTDSHSSSAKLSPYLDFALADPLEWPRSWLIDAGCYWWGVAEQGHIGTVGILSGKGSQGDQANNTLLHYAARGGYTDTVKLLLRKGALIEVTNEYTRLHYTWLQ